MLKKGFVLIFFTFILLISFVNGQSPDLEKKIDESAKSLEGNVTKIRGFTEADKWNFLGAQWKEFLLKNKAIASVDSFFTKINIVFVILFGMDWSLSAQMFFAFLFWLFTFISATKYMSSINKEGIGILYSFIIVVLLAQINLFEYVGKWGVALTFYKESILWQILFFSVVIGFFVIWLLTNKAIADWVKKRRENKENAKDRENKKTFGQWVKAVTGGDWRTENKFP